MSNTNRDTDRPGNSGTFRYDFYCSVGYIEREKRFHSLFISSSNSWHCSTACPAMCSIFSLYMLCWSFAQIFSSFRQQRVMKIPFVQSIRCLYHVQFLVQICIVGLPRVQVQLLYYSVRLPGWGWFLCFFARD